MLFPAYFKRAKPTGGGVAALGSDALPSGAPAAGAGNVLASRATTAAGFPVSRIALGYKYTGAGPIAAVPYTLWIWEAQSQAWYLVSTGSLPAPGASGQGVLAYTSFPAPGDALPPASPVGAIATLLLTSDPGAGAGNGTYEFVMCPDLSSG